MNELYNTEIFNHIGPVVSEITPYNVTNSQTLPLYNILGCKGCRVTS
uniref:Uncharacterized protein n=1 Tax=Antheraea mylitta TaxID=34739 RepID=Q4W4D2_ANTMY|nr:hypothetical protein [Antheraea mylitta]